METIQSIQTVTGPILAIQMPAAFQAKQVKVVITAVEPSPDASEEARAAKIRALIREKPVVSPELRQRLLDNPDLLKPLGYDDPFGPACPPEDWEALS
jgi:hypothetical protein